MRRRRGRKVQFCKAAFSGHPKRKCSFRMDRKNREQLFDAHDYFVNNIVCNVWAIMTGIY